MDTLQKPASTETVCALCGREGDLTVHHLIPKSRHNKPRMRRLYDRKFMREHTALICQPCHKHLHKVLTEQELGEDYNEVEKLVSHPDVARFTEWIRTKPAGWRP
ncbi:MAG: hypothetical protein AAGK14_14980 [Verrucomicrobiota bacterium]